MRLSFLLFLLITSLINSQTLLNIEKSNFFENDIKYSCLLSINELNNLSDEIRYIIFYFPKELKEKRNEIYISKNRNEVINSKTIYKLALFGSNKIIVPYDYVKNNEYLYIQINCYKDKICQEEIIVYLHYKIKIEEGETLYINGYKENYIYNFIYQYKINKNDNIVRQISVNSYHKDDFQFEIINNETDIKHIFNGYSYYLEDKKNKNCINEECFLDLKIKIIKPSAYIMIQIIPINSNKDYNSIELYRPITGLLTENNEKRCFYIEEDNENNLFIDFMVVDEIQSIIYEDSKKN